MKSRSARKFKIFTLSIFLLTVFALCSSNANAIQSEPIAIEIIEATNSSVGYEITYSENYIGNEIKIIVATYSLSNQMKEVLVISKTLPDEAKISGTTTLSNDYSTVKIFLLNANTYAPLCTSAQRERHTHSFSSTWTIDKEATCYEKGSKSHHCLLCDAKTDITEIPQLEHEYQNETCIHCGREVRTITFCDYNGSIISSQIIDKGANAALPQSPERSGFLFAGWDNAYKNVTESKTITAQYVAENAANIFYVTSHNASHGDTITVTLQLKGTVNLCGFDLRLFYDGDALEYIGMDTEHSFDVLANHIGSGHYIRLNYESTKSKKTQGDIITVSFKVLGNQGSSSVISLTPISVINIDPANEKNIINADYSICKGVIFVQ